MRHELKSRTNDAASQLAARRKDILAEYRFYGLDPIKIGREPISLELALQLELLIETPRGATDTGGEA